MSSYENTIPSIGTSFSLAVSLSLLIFSSILSTFTQGTTSNPSRSNICNLFMKLFPSIPRTAFQATNLIFLSFVTELSSCLTEPAVKFLIFLIPFLYICPTSDIIPAVKFLIFLLPLSLIYFSNASPESPFLSPSFFRSISFSSLR